MRCRPVADRTDVRVADTPAGTEAADASLTPHVAVLDQDGALDAPVTDDSSATTPDPAAPTSLRISPKWQVILIGGAFIVINIIIVVVFVIVLILRH